MFGFALSLPSTINSGLQNRAVCKKRCTVMTAADVTPRPANQKLDAPAPENTAYKSMSYQSKEYTHEEIEQLKKKRALMFINRKYSQGS